MYVAISFVLSHTDTVSLSLSFCPGLSYSLVQILSQMMDPTPEKRPTADQILANPTLRRMTLLRPMIRTTHTLLRGGWANA